MNRIPVVALALSILGSLAVTNSPASALVTYTISPGEIINSTISADTILLPAGSQAYFGADVVLSATTKIDIRGALSDYSDGIPRNSSLVSQKDIVIGGRVIASNGTGAPDETSNASVDGGIGGDGGSIYIQWGSLSQFTLASGARLQSGAGGHGGNVTVYSNNASAPNITATGGAAGRAGNITLNGLVKNVYGIVAFGNGGNGGRAIITLATNASYIENHTWNATGGAPTPSGRMPNVAEPCVTMACDFSVGGGGGAACIGPVFSWSISTVASECPEVPELDLPIGIQDLAGQETKACNGSANARGKPGDPGSGGGGDGGHAVAVGCDGKPGTPGGVGVNGGNGGRGTSVTAVGGDGADGVLWGGNGGRGQATGGDGGNGGSAGALANGGNGGNGGSASGIGGNGGGSACSPGNGGSGTAIGGDAGAGGSGGFGGAAGSPGTPGESTAAAGSDGTGGGFCPF